MKYRVLSMFGLAVALQICTMSVLAQKFEGVPVKSGHVSFKFDARDRTYNFVEGGLQQIQGFTNATLVFQSEPKPKENMHLNLTLMYQAPGKVDLEGPFSASGIAMFWGSSVSRYTKGKSKCTITLTKATPTEVEGTADCPLLHDNFGELGKPLTNVKFYATTK
jgi:hypothetical protein